MRPPVGAGTTSRCFLSFALAEVMGKRLPLKVPGDSALAAVIVIGKNTTEQLRVIVSVCHKSFLELLLERLDEEKFDRVHLALGHRAEDVEKVIGNTNFTTDIHTIHETTPLGTGGAIKNAFKHVSANHVVVLNGDSFNEVNYSEILNTARVPLHKNLRLHSVWPHLRQLRVLDQVTEKRIKVTSHLGLNITSNYICYFTLSRRIPLVLPASNCPVHYLVQYGKKNYF